MLDQLSKEYEFYKSNKKKLQKKYNNQFIALKNGKVVASGSDKKKVVKEMLDKKHKLGGFLVHLVSDDSDIVQRYYSRVL